MTYAVFPRVQNEGIISWTDILISLATIILRTIMSMDTLHCIVLSKIVDRSVAVVMVVLVACLTRIANAIVPGSQLSFGGNLCNKRQFVHLDTIALHTRKIGIAMFMVLIVPRCTDQQLGVNSTPPTTSPIACVYRLQLGLFILYMIYFKLNL